MVDEPSTPAPKHTIQIQMDAAGHVSVSGPLENKVLMYGLLEIAREVVVAYNENVAQQKADAEQRAYAEGRSTVKPEDPPPSHQVARTLPFGRNVS